MINEIKGKHDLESESTDVDEENKTETSFWRCHNSSQDFEKITNARSCIMQSLTSQPAPKTPEELEELEL